jgi:hypothetical protein
MVEMVEDHRSGGKRDIVGEDRLSSGMAKSIADEVPELEERGML